jgi:hypothetical protein
MGLLDEAIREHLELKRRRGADPAEIARQEREALGPARAAVDVAPAEPAVAEAAPAAEWEEAPAPTVDEPGFDDDVAEDTDWDDVDGDDGLEVDEADEIEDTAEPQTQVMEPAPRAEAAPSAPAAPPAPAADPGQPTSEYDVLGDEEDHSEPPSFRAAVPDEDAEESDDVLEETPEFLQETPEHDRLWFEQRPPRDFDFDG